MDKCVEMFGHRIKELRNEKNLSLRQLGELLDISKSMWIGRVLHRWLG